MTPLTPRILILRGVNKPIYQNDRSIILFFVVFRARRAMPLCTLEEGSVGARQAVPKTSPDALNSWLIYAVDYFED
jgi:hypothetical protein